VKRFLVRARRLWRAGDRIVEHIDAEWQEVVMRQVMSLPLGVPPVWLILLILGTRPASVLRLCCFKAGRAGRVGSTSDDA
jgi:hypothetical protein